MWELAHCPERCGHVEDSRHVEISIELVQKSEENQRKKGHLKDGVNEIVSVERQWDSGSSAAMHRPIHEKHKRRVFNDETTTRLRCSSIKSISRVRTVSGCSIWTLLFFRCPSSNEPMMRTKRLLACKRVYNGSRRHCGTSTL